MKIWSAGADLVMSSPSMIPGPLVHTGHARYRERLPSYGVPVRAESTRQTQRQGLFGPSFRRPQAKTADTQNTELGIFIDSPQRARELLRVVDISRLQSAWRLRLNDSSALEWRSVEGGREVVPSEEPDAGFWLRSNDSLPSPLVPGQLL